RSRRFRRRQRSRTSSSREPPWLRRRAAFRRPRSDLQAVPPGFPDLHKYTGQQKGRAEARHFISQLPRSGGAGHLSFLVACCRLLIRGRFPAEDHRLAEPLADGVEFLEVLRGELRVPL